MEKTKTLVETNLHNIFIAIDENGWGRAVCVPEGSNPLKKRTKRALTLRESVTALDACGDYRRKQGIPAGKLYLLSTEIGWEVSNA